MPTLLLPPITPTFAVLGTQVDARRGQRYSCRNRYCCTCCYSHGALGEGLHDGFPACSRRAPEALSWGSARAGAPREHVQEPERIKQRDKHVWLWLGRLESAAGPCETVTRPTWPPSATACRCCCTLRVARCPGSTPRSCQKAGPGRPGTEECCNAEQAGPAGG
eukprot:12015980-Alexandrium_andersonii.AAC.1